MFDLVMLHDGENETDSVLTAQDGTVVLALLAVNGIAKRDSLLEWRFLFL